MKRRMWNLCQRSMLCLSWWWDMGGWGWRGVSGLWTRCRLEPWWSSAVVCPAYIQGLGIHYAWWGDDYLFDGFCFLPSVCDAHHPTIRSSDWWLYIRPRRWEDCYYREVSRNWNSPIYLIRKPSVNPVLWDSSRNSDKVGEILRDVGGISKILGKSLRVLEDS